MSGIWHRVRIDSIEAFFRDVRNALDSYSASYMPAWYERACAAGGFCHNPQAEWWPDFVTWYEQAKTGDAPVITGRIPGSDPGANAVYFRTSTCPPPDDEFDD